MGEECKYKWIIFEKDNSVAKIILNNPQKLNALNETMLSEMEVVLRETERDDTVKVIVLRGVGERAFCTGQELETFGVIQPMDMYKYLRGVAYGTHRLMERIEKPIIACVNGHCIAGGLEIALACDFMVASDNASFGISEVSLGIIPGSGGIVRFIRAIPVRKAKEMLYTGARISAKEAEAIGLVNRVVPLADLDKVVKEIADRIVSMSPLSIGMAKVLANHTQEISDIDSALAFERTASSLLMSTEDSKEGAAAFLEKRKAVFKGK